MGPVPPRDGFLLLTCCKARGGHSCTQSHTDKRRAWHACLAKAFYHMRTQGPGKRNSSAKPEEGSRNEGVLRVDRKACPGAGEPGARPGPLAESFLGLCWDRPLGAGQDTDTPGLSWEKQGGRELPSQFYGFCFQGEEP